jgi:hypothetical protein
VDPRSAPEGDSPRPSAESDLDKVNRCATFQDAPSDGASIDRNLRDANGRPWPAGPAPMLLATEANTVATTARADDQMRESADSNERGRPIDGAGQDSRAGGLSASTMLTGAQQPSGRRHASPVGWPAAAPTSTIIVGRDFGRHDRSQPSGPAGPCVWRRPPGRSGPRGRASRRGQNRVRISRSHVARSCP